MSDNRRSRATTEGVERSPNRAMLRAVGFGDDDFTKPIVGVANGQRVPEDWHRLSANALVQHALRSAAGPVWKMDSADMNLVFAGIPTPGAHGAALHA